MKDCKKKILFFLPSSVGGAERVAITISKSLAFEDYDIKYVLLCDKVGEIFDFIPSDKAVIHVKIRNIWDFTIIKLVYLLRKEKPDYTFSTNRYINVRVLLACHIVGNIHSIVRNDNGLETVCRINKILMKLTYPWADKIITQQEEMRQQLLDVMHFSPEKVIVLYNPLDTETIEMKIQAASPYAVSNTIKYVWVGRFAPTKGQDVLVKAFALVHKKNPMTELFFVGKYNDNDYYSKVKELIKEERIESSVHIIGFDDNPYRWVKFCDCFVLPSRYEGLPNSLIEAMYMGVPVVATKCVPIVERIVQDGYNGYLAEVEDTESLASAMEKAIGLKDFEMTYIPSETSDFKNLF